MVFPVRCFLVCVFIVPSLAIFSPSRLHEKFLKDADATAAAKEFYASSPEIAQTFSSLPKFINDLAIGSDSLDPIIGIPTGAPPFNLSENCLIGFASLAANDDRQNLILSMIDASGKPGPGLLWGNVYMEGLYKECLAIKSKEFQTTQATLIMGNCTGSLKIAIDLCVPKGCDKDDVMNLASYGLEIIASGFNNLTHNDTAPAVDACSAYMLKTENDPLITGSYITIVIIIIIAILGISASIFDYFIYHEIKNEAITKTLGMRIFRAFSIYTNVVEIFNVKNVNKPGNIGPLHCMRVFSMIWIIMGHAFTVNLYLASNASQVYLLIYDATTQIIANSYFAVDTFFWQGGLLLSFIWFKQYKKNPKRQTSPIAWILFYVHRFVRISPPFYLIIAFYTWVYSTMAVTKNPVFQRLTEMGYTDSCGENWWISMLYINNFLHYDQQCYVISWYLTTDMQMYFFTPMLLIAFTYGPLFGLLVSGLMFSISTAANVLSVLHFYFPPSDYMLAVMDKRMWLSYSHYTSLMYNAPWIRCQIYIIGFVTGYFLQTIPKCRIPGIVQLIGWIVTGGCVYGCIFPLESWTQGKGIDIGYSALYSATSKVGWGIALSWITVACYYGYGSFINSFMSWPIWVPFGRLTYSAFLLHYIFVIYVTGLYETQVVFTSFLLSILTIVLPVVVLAYLGAIFFSSAVEIATAKVEAALIEALVGAGYSRKEVHKPRRETAHLGNGAVVTIAQRSLPDAEGEVRKRITQKSIDINAIDTGSGKPSPSSVVQSGISSVTQKRVHETRVDKAEIDAWS